MSKATDRKTSESTSGGQRITGLIAMGRPESGRNSVC